MRSSPIPTLRIDARGARASHRAVERAAHEIWYGLEFFRWLVGKPAAAQERAWSTGAYGHKGLAASDYLGRYSERVATALRGQLESMMGAFTGRSPLRVEIGERVVYSPTKNLLYVTPALMDPKVPVPDAAGAIEVALGAALGVGDPGDFAEYLRSRMDSSDDCILSEAQA